MLRIKSDFPEEGQLVLCKVTKVRSHSVFTNLQEYNRTGVIHISEVSPGRIRNIRDYVKEGKVIVCKVLRVDKFKGHIDLSLRRVTDAQRRQKVSEVKQEQLAEKILEFTAKHLNKSVDEVFKSIEEPVFSRYDSLYSCFEEVVKNDKLLQQLGFPKELVKPLTEAIQQRIKPKQVKITGKFILKSYAPDGIDVIKKCLQKTQAVNRQAIDLYYLGAGAYHIKVTAEDYKSAEKILDQATKQATSFMKKSEGEAEFVRTEK